MGEKDSIDKRLLALISLLIGVIVGINIWMGMEGWDMSDDDDYDDHHEDREKWNSSQVGEINLNVKIDIEEGKSEVKVEAVEDAEVEAVEDAEVEAVDEVLVSKSEPESVVPKCYPSSFKVLTDGERIEMEREMSPVPETFHHFVEDRRTHDSLDTLSMFPARNMFGPNAKVPETFIEGIDEEEADKLAVSEPLNSMPDVILERILQEHMLPSYEMTPYNFEAGFNPQKAQSSVTDINSEPVLNSEATLNGQVNLDQMMDAVDGRMPSMHELTNDTSILLEDGKTMTADSRIESEETTRIPEFDPFGRNEFVHPFWESLGLNLGHRSETTDQPPLAPMGAPMGAPIDAPMDVQPLKPFMFLSEPKVLKPAHHPFIGHLLRISRARLGAQGLEATTTSPSDTEISDGIPFLGSQYQEPELKEPELKEPELKEPELKELELKEPELKEPELNHDMFNSQNPSIRILSNLQTRPVAAESISGFYGQDPFFSGDQRFQYETVIDDKSEGSEYQGSNPQEQVQYMPLSSFNLPSFEIKNETASEEKDEEKDEEETLPSQSDHVFRKQVFRSETEPMFKQIYPSLIESRNEK